MSSMKNKREIAKGKIQILCANCNADRGKETNSSSTPCPVCGFNPAFPNLIVQRLEDSEKQTEELKGKLAECEKEFARQLEFLVNKRGDELKLKLQQVIDKYSFRTEYGVTLVSKTRIEELLKE